MLYAPTYHMPLTKCGMLHGITFLLHNPQDNFLPTCLPGQPSGLLTLSVQPACMAHLVVCGLIIQTSCMRGSLSDLQTWLLTHGQMTALL